MLAPPTNLLELSMAAFLIDMPVRTFQRRIEKGQIRPVAVQRLPNGRRRHLFHVEHIEKLRRPTARSSQR